MTFLFVNFAVKNAMFNLNENNRFVMARLAMMNGVKPFLARLFMVKKIYADVINFSKSF